MRNKHLTNKQAAELLNLPESTFREKAKTEWKLRQVELFSGRKGKRWIEREVLQVAERAERERDKEQARIRKAQDDAARNGLKLVG